MAHKKGAGSSRNGRKRVSVVPVAAEAPAEAETAVA